MNVVTCKEAKAKGLPRYFTGRPCKQGHVCERKTRTKQCVECLRANSRAWRGSDTPAALARRRDKSRAESARRNGWAAPPRERDCPPRPADGRCQGCDAITGKPLMMDHCHVDGPFRAWVCQKCNHAPERVMRKPADKLAVEIAHEARRLGLPAPGDASNR